MLDMSAIGNSPFLTIIFKTGVLVVFAFYVVFLLIILKQIRSMNTIITQPDLFPIIQIALFGLIGFAIFLFLLGLAIL